jgi:2-polyprenyl-6-methoxyphenol hydroxylase-like FAD-dependent oxidoreductase
MAMADGPLQVAVAGGSIGGLCAGLALQRIAGAEVDIYERHVGEVETRGAGIVVQPELTQLLRLVDAAELPTTGCEVRRYLDRMEAREASKSCRNASPPGRRSSRRYAARFRTDATT